MLQKKLKIFLQWKENNVRKIISQPAAFWALLGLLLLFSAYLGELQLYNDGIKPYVEYADFISIPGKKFINIEDGRNSLYFYREESKNVFLHKKTHDNADDATSCRRDMETGCYKAVRLAEFKGDAEYWKRFIFKGKLPSAENEIAINARLSKDKKLGVGDKAILEIPSKNIFKKIIITGIVRNSYAFPRFCMPDYTTDNDFCRNNYKFSETDLYMVFGTTIPKTVAYSFSDEENKKFPSVNIDKWLKTDYKETLHKYSIVFFIISLFADLIALFCFNKSLKFRQYCNHLLILGKPIKYVKSKKVRFSVYFICLCMSISLCAYMNFHFFIVNALAACAAVAAGFCCADILIRRQEI